MHAETETVARILDPLDDTILGNCIYNEPRPGGFDRLMVRTIDPEGVYSGDPVEEGAGDHANGVPRLVARVRLAMR